MFPSVIYCRNFQMLERQSRVIHLQFLKDVKLQQMTDSQQEMLLYHLKDLSFLEVRITDTIKGGREQERLVL